MSVIKIGLIGCGTVGGSVCEILKAQAARLEERVGVSFEIVKVAVRDLKKTRSIEFGPGVLTQDWEEVVENGEVDLVVELIGGTGLAFKIVERALKAGKPVITGNKALLAEKGEEVFKLSAKTGVPVMFEAAVAGGIPIIKTLKESFISNEITSLVGIINGTCNYILERMTEAGLGYAEALHEAMELGYAEADPTLDINGWDAAHKAILLAMVCSGTLPDYKEVYVKGIDEVKLEDIAFADKLGYVIKLVSAVKFNGEKKSLEIRTQPSLIPKSHILATVDGVFNAVSIKGDVVGDSFLYGRGAGGGPTATAVISDIMDAVTYLQNPSVNRGLQLSKESYQQTPIQETESAYFVCLNVKDESGVMASITALFSKMGMSISGTYSNIDPNDPDAIMNRVSFVTHSATFQKVQETVQELEGLAGVTSTPTTYRIESF